jgi:hypothetical protein
MEEIGSHLYAKGVAITKGLIKRMGTIEEIELMYIRDPDQNLIKISVYLEKNYVKDL